MNETITLTEQELKEMIKETIVSYINDKLPLLSEAAHYPEFLNKFKFHISDFIIDKLQQGFYNEEFVIPVEGVNYARFIRVLPIARETTDKEILNDDHYYSAKYVYEDSIYRDGVFAVGVIQIEFPIMPDGMINYSLIHEAIIHELNHLYDDWQYRRNQVKRGTEIPKPLSYGTQYVDITNALKSTLLEPFAILSYYNISTETKAFISMIPTQLDRYNVTKQNMEERVRQTGIYKEVNDAYRQVMDLLKKNDIAYLQMVNNALNRNYKNTGIPRVDNIVWDEYKPMMMKWADECYSNFIKKFFDTVLWYVDKNDESKKFVFETIHSMDEIARLNMMFDRRRGLMLNELY